MKKNLFLRIVFYVAGLLILALGIILNTKSGLGVSPIISVAYSITTIGGFNFGNITFLLYSAFVVVEIVLHIFRNHRYSGEAGGAIAPAAHRDLKLVLPELDFFLEKKVLQVKFVDRTFNAKKSHAMAIWKHILEHDNGVTNFHFEISADLIRENELELMSTMRPGLIQLEIGVQSTNPDTIRAIHRTMDFPRLAEIVNRIHSFQNIHQHLDLIAGLPYEDYESFHRSFNDVYALKPQQLQLGFLKVLKGSHMKEMVEEYQIVYKEQEPYEVLETKWLPYEDILRLKMVESMVEVYYNSGQFQNTIACIEPLFEDAFTLYEKLGQYYEKKGYSEISHSRMRRYEILLEFVREETGGSKDAITWEKVADSMIYDLYLREKLKSHPSFEKDQKPYEKAIWEYRRREEIPKTAQIEVFRDGRVLLFDYENRDPLLNNAAVREIQL